MRTPFHRRLGRHHVAFIVLTIMSASWSLLSAQQPAPVEPLVRANAIEKIADHVYWIPDNDVPQVANIGIIVGNTATLVIDTGLGPRNGTVVAQEASKVSRGATQYLAMTHYHPEHDLGAQGFPATTKVIRSRIQDRDLAELGLGSAIDFATASPFNTSLLKGVNFRKTDISFDSTYRLDLGGVHVRLMSAGPTHTRGDTVFVIEEDRVMFAGDVVMPSFPGFSVYSSARAWSATLDRLAMLNPAIVVPSHGRRGDATMIATYRDYFRTLQARAAQLKRAGKPSDETAAVLRDEMPAKYPTLAYRGTNRVTLAAQTAYNEAQ